MNGEGVPPQEFANVRPSQAEQHETAGIYRFDAKTVASDKHPERDEDTYFIDAEHPAIGVFDGVQTADGSELAASVSAETTHDILGQAPSIVSPKTGCNYAYAALLQADLKIRQESPDISATAVALKLFTSEEGQLFAAVPWSGDSRAYRLRGGVLEMLTADHSLASHYATSDDQALDFQEILSSVETREQADQLSPQLKEAFDGRHKITSSLGGAGEPTISVRAYAVLPGDKYILMTDGVSDNLTTAQIETLAAAENAPDALITYAQVVSRKKLFRSKPDDMTVVTLTIA